MVTPAERCTDREFIRRVTLDLAGRIPSIDEVHTFLSDNRENKREALVEELLNSEDYAQHFADIFDVLLMGRADEDKYDQRQKHGWRAYLERAFRDNRPWDEVAREVLLARPSDEQQSGAVWFLYERNDQHQAIAEAIAPAFFGVRIECAQCHDHMLADEIKQAHYWGMVAFFNRSKNEMAEAGPRVAESALGGFSEFANLTGSSSPNVLSFLAAPTVDEPRPKKDEKQEQEAVDALYVAAEVAGEPRVPKFSRRQKFVDEVLRQHPLVARAMVNRLWAIMLGRGSVHPYDEMDSAHPASHPELLDWLSQDFAKSGYDVRRLVRSLALCEAYQLRSIRPDSGTDPATFAWYLERPLTAEQLARSIQMVTHGQCGPDAALVKQFRQQFKEVLPDQIVIGIADTLFLTNGTALEQHLRDSEHLIWSLRELDTPQQRVQRLFELAFCRDPTVDESAAAVRYLAEHDAFPKSAMRQVLWSLITSAEFQFNH